MINPTIQDGKEKIYSPMNNSFGALPNPTTQDGKEKMKVGEHLSIFIEEMQEIDAVNYRYYFRGAKEIVKEIIRDVEKEYEMCPRFSNFAYEHILLSLKRWLTDLELADSAL